MLMVIFGAGASYDSVPSRPPAYYPDLQERPPLADQLFDDRPRFTNAMNYFPACQWIVPFLRHRQKNTSVEQVLEGLQSEANDYPERHRQLAAVRFYLHYMLWECEQKWNEVAKGITNYKTLLDQIEYRRRKYYKSVCFVTFNYDTMLEDALKAFGIPIRGLQDYIANDSYKIIKVHGSANWARDVETPIADLDSRNSWQVARELIERAAELQISQTYRVVTEYPIGKLAPDNIAIFPAVAIPVETKRAFECPERHLDVLRRCIREVTKVLIIGWQGTEHHFVELLRELGQPRIIGMIVVGEQSLAERVAIRLQHLPVVWGPARSGFTDFVTSGDAGEFLSL